MSSSSTSRACGRSSGTTSQGHQGEVVPTRHPRTSVTTRTTPGHGWRPPAPLPRDHRGRPPRRRARPQDMDEIIGDAIHGFWQDRPGEYRGRPRGNRECRPQAPPRKPRPGLELAHEVPVRVRGGDGMGRTWEELVRSSCRVEVLSSFCPPFVQVGVGAGAPSRVQVTLASHQDEPIPSVLLTGRNTFHRASSRPTRRLCGRSRGRSRAGRILVRRHARSRVNHQCVLC